MKEYKSHPLAELFPLMPASDIKELADDIKKRGLQNPITLCDGKILDGQHRYEACLIAKVKPRFEIYKGNDPMGFVIAANLKRRHLTTSQKAMVAAAIENMPHGRSEKKDANLHLTRTNAADSLDISPRSVATASKILDESPALAAQVRDGKISVHAAAEKLADKKAERETRKDALGRTVPDEVVPDWDRAESVAARLRSCASEIKVTVERGLADKDIVFAEITNPTIAEASGLHYTLSQIAPHAVCPACQGRQRSKCQLCRRRGWISKFLFNSPAVSAATRALLAKVGSK